MLGAHTVAAVECYSREGVSLGMATCLNLLHLACPNLYREYNTYPLKKSITRYGFNFVPKHVLVGLTGTHKSPMGLQFTILGFIIINKFNITSIKFKVKYMLSKKFIVY